MHKNRQPDDFLQEVTRWEGALCAKWEGEKVGRWEGGSDWEAGSLWPHFPSPAKSNHP